MVKSSPSRVATLSRKTLETEVSLTLGIDGRGEARVDTGIPFFDHMLTLLARHALFDLTLTAKGDVDVDYHHTVEDVGLTLGAALKQALGDKMGIRRYGFFFLPMDEALARVVVDLGGRPYLAYKVPGEGQFVRDFDVGLVKEFCRAFSNSLGANLHVMLLAGEDPHHIAEAIFKGLGRALAAAAAIDPRAPDVLPSTKGTLQG